MTIAGIALVWLALNVAFVALLAAHPPRRENNSRVVDHAPWRDATVGRSEGGTFHPVSNSAEAR